MELRIDHTCGAAAAAERLARAAAENGLELACVAGALAGTLEKRTPLGTVRAEYEVLEAVVAIRVSEKPAFLSDELLERLIREGLAAALA